MSYAKSMRIEEHDSSVFVGRCKFDHQIEVSSTGVVRMDEKQTRELANMLLTAADDLKYNAPMEIADGWTRGVIPSDLAMNMMCEVVGSGN